MKHLTINLRKIIWIALVLGSQFCMAKTFVIDGRLIKTKSDLLSLVNKELNYNRDYGQSLDSIYDMLVSDTGQDRVIKIKHAQALEVKVGKEFAQGLIKTVAQAAEDNNHLIMVLE